MMSPWASESLTAPEHGAGGSGVGIGLAGGPSHTVIEIRRGPGGFGVATATLLLPPPQLGIRALTSRSAGIRKGPKRRICMGVISYDGRSRRCQGWRFVRPGKKLAGNWRGGSLPNARRSQMRAFKEETRAPVGGEATRCAAAFWPCHRVLQLRRAARERYSGRVGVGKESKVNDFLPQNRGSLQAGLSQ
jgi:hypothetical protein